MNNEQNDEQPAANRNTPLKRIMYVEDDPDLQEIVRMGLEIGGGFTVNVCESGAQALAKVMDYQPDLILLDVVLPEMSGPQTLKELRKIPVACDIPVVFLTSKVRPMQLLQYKSLGAVGVIRKPLNPMKLASQIKEIWQEYLNGSSSRTIYN
jgi:CheY-like chemotaxis protein